MWIVWAVNQCNGTQPKSGFMSFVHYNRDFVTTEFDARSTEPDDLYWQYLSFLKCLIPSIPCNMLEYRNNGQNCTIFVSFWKETPEVHPHLHSFIRSNGKMVRHKRTGATTASRITQRLLTTVSKKKQFLNLIYFHAFYDRWLFKMKCNICFALKNIKQLYQYICDNHKFY